MKEEIEKAVDVLRKEGVILFPGDTNWALGCDATNFEAIETMNSIIRADDQENTAILIEHEGRLTSYINDVPDVAWELIDVTDKPLTVIYPGAKNLAMNLISEDGSAAIRVVRDEFCQQLLRRFKKPLASIFLALPGFSKPDSFDKISDEMKDRVDYAVSYGQDINLPNNSASIIKLGTGGQIEILKK
jgi:L-threonylcarbamoyladenylate synthase